MQCRIIDGVITVSNDGEEYFEVESLPEDIDRNLMFYRYDAEASEFVLDQEAVDEEAKRYEKQSRIVELKRLLYNTDYVVIKIAEGSSTQEQYQSTIESRRKWRSEINELEDQLRKIT